MTDLAPEPTLGPAPSLEPGQVAAMREQWTSLGLDAAAFDAAAAGSPVTPTSGALEPGAVEADADGLVALKTPSLTPEQAQEMAAALLASGVPQDQIDAAMKADGYGPAPVDDRTEEQKEFDAAFAGAEPSAYKISYVGRIPAGMTTPELAELNKHATEWLSAIAFPPEIGPSVIERLIDTGNQLNSMSASERELWKAEQEASFERLAGGPEKAAERRSSAVNALALAPSGLTNAMIDGGAIHDAGVQMFLALQWERLVQRWG